MRALWFEFPEDEELYGVDRQFMIGSDILVTPVLTPDISFVDGMWIAGPRDMGTNVSQVSSLAETKLFGEIGTPTAQSTLLPNSQYVSKLPPRTFPSIFALDRLCCSMLNLVIPSMKHVRDHFHYLSPSRKTGLLLAQHIWTTERATHQVRAPSQSSGRERECCKSVPKDPLRCCNR